MSAGVIEEASYSGIVLPGPSWHTLNHQGRNAHLAYRVRVQCTEHYYNATCTKFCRPRNDIFGHYNCDNNGDKECIAGWKGVDCETGESVIFICYCPLLGIVPLTCHSIIPRRILTLSPIKNIIRTMSSSGKIVFRLSPGARNEYRALKAKRSPFDVFRY